MKFYKLVEITEEEYYNKTGDAQYEYCEQSLMKEDDGVYIAVSEDAYELSINMEDLEDDDEEEEPREKQDKLIAVAVSHVKDHGMSVENAVIKAMNEVLTDEDLKDIWGIFDMTQKEYVSEIIKKVKEVL